MALPMNTMPAFNVTIPSTGKKVKFRPFVVKEEKALLIAQQSEDPQVMIDTLKNVLGGCLLDPVDIDSLATFDLEYLFLQIRGKSVGETVELLFACDNDHGDQNEKARSKVILNLQDIQVVKNPEHDKKIKLFNNVGVIMKYPTLDVAEVLREGGANDADTVFDMITTLIECIYDGDEVFNAEDTPKGELLEFLNNLSSEQFGKIQKFFDTMPKLRTNVEYKCPLCGKEHKKTLEGLENFF